jgi:hypothetical protein
MPLSHTRFRNLHATISHGHPTQLTSSPRLEYILGSLSAMGLSLQNKALISRQSLGALGTFKAMSFITQDRPLAKLRDIYESSLLKQASCLVYTEPTDVAIHGEGP